MADDIRPSTCANCGSDVFGLRGDWEEGVARRTCRRCGLKAFICDSEDHWSDATIRTCKCPCGGPDFNLAFGFCLRAEGEVRWVTVGERCINCGVLGSFVDWKIDYSPSAELLDRV